MTLKVVSWNIWFGTHYHDIVKHLKESDANIIALQEVIQETDGSDNVAENIAKELGYHWKYVETTSLPYQGRTVSWGNAILSRHKILATRVHELSSGTERRTALQATIEMPHDHINVFSTQLTHTHQKPSLLQEAQAEALIKEIPKTKAIVMGDFNALPDSNIVQAVSRVIQSTDTQLDPSWCIYKDGCDVCQVEELLYRLDYIFATPDLKVQSFQTDYSKGSDHLPIATTLEV